MLATKGQSTPRGEMATERINKTKLAGNAQDGPGRSHELGKGGKSKRVRRELDRPTIRSVLSERMTARQLLLQKQTAERGFGRFPEPS